jgi:hypothetical protein
MLTTAVVDAIPLPDRGRGDGTCWRRRCGSRGLPRCLGQPVGSVVPQDGRVEPNGVADIV